MGLSKKTFLYSILISGAMVLFVVIYFVLMLPSLYVAHVKDGNLEAVAEIQRGFIKHHNYNGLKIKNPTSTVTFEIPSTGETIHMAGKMFKATVTLDDSELKKALTQLRDIMKHPEKLDEAEAPDFDFEGLKEKFTGNQLLEGIKIEAELTGDETAYQEQSVKFHQLSDSLVVMEAIAGDGNNQYSNYMAFTNTDDALVITVLSTVTPQITEIRPIVLGSIPMIAAVVFFLVLIFSQVFSRRIVNPVIQLAHYADDVKTAGNLEVPPLVLNERDEIGELSRSLNELYETLRENYRELEAKNQELLKENERQEVFLRASSHQLKTPIAAALLLTEGMIDEIGKYKDSKSYLPKVKEQLIVMRKMVDDILSLNYKIEDLEAENLSVKGLTQEILTSYRIQTADKSLQIHLTGETEMIDTYPEVLKKILDNLIANAVAYTPAGQKVEFIFAAGMMTVRNYGVTIDPAILPHIFDPFVSGSSQKKGHGLGLYIVAYCTRLLKMRIEVDNIENGVEFRLIW